MSKLKTKKDLLKNIKDLEEKLSAVAANYEELKEKEKEEAKEPPRKYAIELQFRALQGNPVSVVTADAVYQLPEDGDKAYESTKALSAMLDQIAHRWKTDVFDFMEKEVDCAY